MKFVLKYEWLFKIVVLILLIALLFVNIWISIDDVKETKYLVSRQNRNLQEIKQHRNEMMSLLMAEKTEEITNNIKTDQEKAVVLAKWVSANISNREPLGEDEYGWFAYRSGLCGARAAIFVKMLSFLHIPAKIFNMYNFGGGGAGGHSNAQVYYDGDWHFYDITYAGIFVNDQGCVMSWDAIVKDPEYAVKHMVVFKETKDRYGNLEQDTTTRHSVSNVERMKYNYTVKNLQEAKSYGFYRDGKVKVLYPIINTIQLRQQPLFLGQIDGSFTDVDKEGIQYNHSQCLGGLGTLHDNLHFQWRFTNCIPGETYIIEYHINKATHKGLNFYVKVLKGRLIDGGEFVSSTSDVKGKQRIWRIKFKSATDNCSVYVGYDFKDQGKYISVDQIKIGIGK